MAAGAGDAVVNGQSLVEKKLLAEFDLCFCKRVVTGNGDRFEAKWDLQGDRAIGRQFGFFFLDFFFCCVLFRFDA